MNFKRIIMLALVSVMLLGTLLCAVSCDEGATEDQSTGATTNAPQSTQAATQAPSAEQTTEQATSGDGKVTYTVKVVDANGQPVANVEVQFCDDSVCHMPVPTNAEGIVTQTVAPGNFHVTLAKVPAGFAEDKTEYYFEDTYELTVTLNAAE